MLVRIGYGALRVILGLTLLKFFMGQPFSDILFKLMEHELMEDKQDILFSLFKPLAAHMHYGVTYFVAGYLLFWGIMDIFLSIQLLFNRMWAYPVSIILIYFFIAYELFRVSFTHSKILVVVIVWDLIVIWFIRREQQKILKHQLPTSDGDMVKSI